MKILTFTILACAVSLSSAAMPRALGTSNSPAAGTQVALVDRAAWFRLLDEASRRPMRRSTRTPRIATQLAADDASLSTDELVAMADRGEVSWSFALGALTWRADAPAIAAIVAYARRDGLDRRTKWLALIQASAAAWSGFFGTSRFELSDDDPDADTVRFLQWMERERPPLGADRFAPARETVRTATVALIAALEAEEADATAIEDHAKMVLFHQDFLGTSADPDESVRAVLDHLELLLTAKPRVPDREGLLVNFGVAAVSELASLLGPAPMLLADDLEHPLPWDRMRPLLASTVAYYRGVCAAHADPVSRRMAVLCDAGVLTTEGKSPREVVGALAALVRGGRLPVAVTAASVLVQTGVVSGSSPRAHDQVLWGETEPGEGLLDIWRSRIAGEASVAAFVHRFGLRYDEGAGTWVKTTQEDAE
jgi:hypothetical protein